MPDQGLWDWMPNLGGGSGSAPDYSANVPQKYLPYYQQLVRNGLPPVVANSIITKPWHSEDESPPPRSDWPYPYTMTPDGQEPYHSEIGPLENFLTSRLGRYHDISYQPNGGNMPWPNLTPQELAAYQMMSNPQMGQAQGMTPQMMAYLQMMQNNPGMQFQQAPPITGQANALTGGLAPRLPMGAPGAPTGAQAPPSNMSTIFNNPQLMQLLMQRYGGGAGM